MTDVPHQYRLAVDHFDRRLVEQIDRVGQRVGENLEIPLADLDVTRRDENVFPQQGLLHVHQREAVTLQLLAVDISQNAAQLASVNGRRNHALNRLQLVAQLEVGDVVQLLLVHFRVRDHHQTERQRGRGVERHQHRRNRARRQIEQVAHGVAGHLGHGGVHRDVFAEVILDDAHPLHRLGFLMLDADRLAGPPLHAVHDVLFHHLRRHAGIERDNLHRRRGVDGQQVFGDFKVGADPHHQRRQGDDDDNIRFTQCSSDHGFLTVETRNFVADGLHRLLTRA